MRDYYSTGPRLRKSLAFIQGCLNGVTVRIQGLLRIGLSCLSCRRKHAVKCTKTLPLRWGSAWFAWRPCRRGRATPAPHGRSRCRCVRSAPHKRTTTKRIKRRQDKKKRRREEEDKRRLGGKHVDKPHKRKTTREENKRTRGQKKKKRIRGQEDKR